MVFSEFRRRFDVLAPHLTKKHGRNYIVVDERRVGLGPHGPTGPSSHCSDPSEPAALPCQETTRLALAQVPGLCQPRLGWALGNGLGQWREGSPGHGLQESQRSHLLSRPEVRVSALC